MTLARFPLAVLAFAAAASVSAADHYGRLTVDVKIEGKGQTQRGKDYSRSTTAQNVHMAFNVMRSGDGDDRNMLDDAGNAAEMEKYAAASRARAPSPEKQKEVMMRMQKEAEACRNDVNCMQAVALKMAKETASWAAPAPDHSADEGRYFNYIPVGAAQCKGEFTAKIADSEEGAYSDVAGMRPFTTKVAADFKAGELEKATVCIGSVTVDSRTGKLYSRLAVPVIKGRHRSTDAGHVTHDSADSQLLLNADAMKWAFAQLNGGARSGVQRTTLKAPLSSSMAGQGEQTLNVEVRWTFDGK
ncbi:hypothetical protein [Massilia endophytica]|uniref:hypothetical protein n=1 Tax=Massilia endophytica TaxID=2899220 RepID=UPI001E4D2E55|nr:hypothetical protein [Massilia endophytica]UGQ46821.1 hypothetical protein LSQ66_24180 [Massilia endophytica]